MAEGFIKKRDEENRDKIERLCRDLPPYVEEFVNDSKRTYKSTLTKLAYVYDIRTFLYFLPQKVAALKGVKPSQITTEQLENLTLLDFDAYARYLQSYRKPLYGTDDVSLVDQHAPYTKDKLCEHTGKTQNKGSGAARKIIAVRQLYKFLFKHGLISKNVTENLDVPEQSKHEIIYFTKEEIAMIKSVVRNGFNTTGKQTKFLENTRLRDIAIMSLLLGTGIRASECVGLDLDDINHHSREIYIMRKGNKTMTLKVPLNAYEDLCAYLEEREKIVPAEGHEKAVFLSSQRKRMCTRTLQNLVKKYTQAACPHKPMAEFDHFSPHKLRASYATNLFENTHDIEKVSQRLGHSGLSTVKRYVKYTEKDDDDVDW